MKSKRPIYAQVAAGLFGAAALASALGSLSLQAQTPVVLDRVVAVVNRQAILSSDIDEEIRLSVVDPARSRQVVYTRQQALDRIISRTLIQQQIRHDDLETAEPSPEEVETRLLEIRKDLPECVPQNCASEQGWKAFLAAHDLTEEKVTAYFRNRLEILSFIEERFRSGIHIPQQDIENYYRNTLLPQYKSGETAPALEKVAPRIEEILLQQQVTAMFAEWLTNLHKQGDVEILDPSLEGPVSANVIQHAAAGTVKEGR